VTPSIGDRPMIGLGMSCQKLMGNSPAQFDIAGSENPH
jgi:hypothetical protein